MSVQQQVLAVVVIACAVVNAAALARLAAGPGSWRSVRPWSLLGTAAVLGNPRAAESGRCRRERSHENDFDRLSVATAASP